LENVIADKNAVISEGITLKGTKERLCFIEKNQVL
jgi:ADP-glucose pyrophosphorylase